MGLEARIVLNDELVVTNRTESPALILDESGRTLHTIAARKSFAWHDRRLGASGPPPRASGVAPKNWRIPGRVRGKRFAIEGFTGYVPPPVQPAADDGSSRVVPVVAAVVLLAIAASAVYLFERRRG
ncbi:MAG: hypothetical protein ACRDKK_02545 [Gaiellaceae bacterium]